MSRDKPQPMTPEELHSLRCGNHRYWDLDRLLATVEAKDREIAALQNQLAAVTAENASLLNDASIWRNRAVGAETTLAGLDQIDLGSKERIRALLDSPAPAPFDKFVVDDRVPPGEIRLDDWNGPVLMKIIDTSSDDESRSPDAQLADTRDWNGGEC